jgi:hypothetical protein
MLPTNATWISMLVIVLFAAIALGSEENSKEGQISLKEVGKGAKEPAIELGKNVKLGVNAHIANFVGKPIINANANIKNLTSVPQVVTYVITFYDAQKNIIGAYGTTCTVEPNKETGYGSALIHGKMEDFKKVTSYRLYACAYETTIQE